MTAAAELADLRARLAVTVAEWRRWIAKQEAAGRLTEIVDVTRDFADEIEALLGPVTAPEREAAR